jgi:amino acid adenylation domain-containing protein/non-ribosomal peptide synthase protein (TIGR01720 family)
VTLQALLADAAARKITLAVVGDELHVRAAKGTVDAAMKAALLQHKPGLLDLLRRRDEATGDGSPIPRVPRDAVMPLSFSQRRIWFLDQLEGGRAVYHVPACAWLDGPLDVGALRRALTTLVDRHESLQTTIVVTGTEPAQRIAPVAVTLTVESLANATNPDAEAERRATLLVREPFDLARGPLFRVRLFKTAAHRHLLALSLHHIIADAWSMGVLLSELARVYEGERSGTVTALDPLAVQYVDYAAWQRRQLTGDRLNRLVAYWRKRLAGAPDLLELPTDRPRPATQSFRGGMERFVLDHHTASSVRVLAADHGATLFQTLLAVFQALLHRHSRQESVVVGSPIANRLRAETEPVVGFFVNTLALRAEFSEALTFAALLEQVKQTTIDAYAHQELPFETLVAELSPARSLSHNPVFQAMCALQNAPDASLRMTGVAVTQYRVDLGISKFDIYLSLEEQPDGSIAGEWEFASDLFDPATIRRMIAQFRALIEAVVRQPDERVSRLALMSGDDAQQILVGWNRTDADWPRDATLVSLIAEQTARTPDAIAVIDARERLTYRELEQRANRLANYLRRLGAGAETLVGVCVPRACDMITAVLGILKSGAAYVPLDPAYPRERIAFMVEDAAMPIVVTHSTTAAHLPADRARLVRLDIDRASIAAEPATAPGLAIAPASLGYVIYTSGSTGQPKGIQIEHRHAVSMLTWATGVFAPADLRGTLASTSLCFDLSIFEIFLPLITGGAVIVAENALALPEHPAASEVTLVNTVPSAIAELVRSGGVPASVRIVNLAGEPLKASLVDQIYALPHVCAVFDLYGPGETTTYSTWTRREPGGRESIGRPIANTTVYILDQEMHPAAIGVPGEIYIGGPGVTRGYLNREELTRQRYVPNPFGPGRLYRTGDLARFWPDGEIQYLGRIDHQVKIRGFRIELGEIENALAQHPAVRESVVVAQDIDGGKRLVAYFCGDAEVADLRSQLQRTLAAFMVPAIFVRLDVLPKTPNGKVDRRALPDPDAARGEAHSQDLAPATPSEAILCGIWRDVLRRPFVSAGENFFEIGGDSILAIQIVSRARDAGLAITPPQIFAHQTIAELAAAAGVSSHASAGDPADESDRDVPLTGIQRWGLGSDEPDPHHFNQWLLLDVPRDLTDAIVEQAIHLTGAHHGALRLRFHRDADDWRQRYDATADAFIVETIAVGADEAEVLREAAHVHAALDLQHGPVARAVLFKRVGAASRLLLTVHHLAIDGVSWRILCDDVVAVCSQLRRGESPRLPARTAPYSVWADSPASAVAIPLVSREANGTYADADRVAGALDERMTRALLEAVPRATRARPDEAILAAVGLALADTTGTANHGVDIEGHGRDLAPELDLTRTVGWFTAIHAVSLTIDRMAGPGDALARVKALREESAGAIHPPAAVSFNYLGQIDQLLPADSGWRLVDAGLSASPNRRRAHALAVAASVRGGRLEWQIEFNGADRSRASIVQLSSAVAGHLAAIIAHCESLNANELEAVVATDPVRLRGNVESIDPASPAQEGMLFHSLLAAGADVYMTQISFALDGPLDGVTFRAAWDAVVARHDTLRTCFARDAKQHPLLVTLTRVVLPFAVLDLRGAADANARLAAFENDDRLKGFDTAAAPLTRVTLVRMQDDSHVCVWTSHHAILDGWSLAVILRDLASCYERGAGAVAGLPAIRPFREHLAHRRQMPVADAEAFWRDEVGSWGEKLDLPFELPLARRASQTSGGARELRRELPVATVAAMTTFARRHRLTLHTLLQGAWAVLLSRHTDRDEVIFGATVSGRAVSDLPAIESTAGLFIETVPARVLVDDSQPVAVWLQSLQTRQLQRDAHAHLPLVRIQELSALSRATPLFDTLLVYENYPVDGALQRGIGDLSVRDVRSVERPHYPLTIVATGDTAMTLTALYDVDRFDAAAIDRVLARYERVLTLMSTAAEGGLVVGDLSLMSPAEEHEVVVAWNATEQPYAPDVTIVDLFEAQAARTPDAIAVVFNDGVEDESLTYAELDRWSNRLAHHLQARGVGPDVLVAVCLERSLEMVVALYGILKAGGAYVPIDPAYPEERRRFMLNDLGAAIVLDEAQVREVDGPDTAPPRAIDRRNLAYMIYTSGSTGQPKGALNTHGGIANRLLWMQDAFGLTAADAVLQKTPFSFDVSVWEFFWPLIAGARLIVARPGGHADAEYLAETIDTCGITTIHFVPSILQAFLDTPSLGRCSSLRRVIASGEALTPDHVRTFHDRLRAELHNLYGPTEAAVDVTWWPTTAGDAGSTIPIGRPIANTRIYILDRRGRAVPAGVPGELHIGGVQVGRGYLNRPALTAEKFIADPFSDDSGSRLYRTGDLARFADDGRIEYLGRIDHQVKIRGVRIELGEIEALLRSQPEVRDALVVARGEGGDRDLVAYLVANPGSVMPEPKVLRDRLRTRLPEPMVPSFVVTLDSLPLLPNGKINRHALPDPRAGLRGSPPVEQRGAQSDAVRRIAEVWREVLGVEQVGLDENFFDLGGHSLKMMRVHGRLQQLFGGGVSLVDLFEHPTVRAIAAYLSGQVTAPAIVKHPSPASTIGPYDVAVIGMACRFPDAATPDEFWRNLIDARESITSFTAEELIAAGEDPARVNDPRYVKAYGALGDADRFDASFFDIPPREAEILDPQQRMFLECAWEAFERAGYDPSRLERPAGVFAGAGMNTYALRHLQSRPDVLADHGAFPILIANDKDYLPTRVSYKLNLKGPSVTVQTACSTSLVAIVMACESIARGECDMALAGGVTVRFPQVAGHLWEEGMIFSPDGHTRAFDAQAGGIVTGSGAGVVLLKRLAEAIADGDHIHAVIKGAALNNDGAAKVGYTAPSLEGQTRVVSSALDRAGVDPRTIGYVEAHGTATPVGDPIEMAALTRAWRAHTDATAFCAIGSVKTNLGHLDAAAGVAGFMKATLAVEHGQIPPSLHFETPNPRLEMETSPFFVNNTPIAWTGDAGLRRAAVSSFGIGGTNAHLILEAAPTSAPVASTRPWHLLALSARTASALDRATGRLADFLDANPGVDLGDVSSTLVDGRQRFSHRRSLVCRSREDALRLLRGADPLRVSSRHDDHGDRDVVFLFSGNGTQYAGMARGLYESEPLFREHIDRAAGILLRHGLGDIRDAIAGSDPALLRRLETSNAALFAMQYALAQLWASWGVEPAAVIGNSLGQYAAACIAGVFTFEDALLLVADRGHLIDTTSAGALIAVPLDETNLRTRLTGTLALAVVTGTAHCVVSGSPDEVAVLTKQLAAEGVETRPIETERAAHGPLMDTIVAELTARVMRTPLRAPRIPIVSNVSGTWMTDAEATDPACWAKHLRTTVQLSAGIETLLRAHQDACLLEIGAGRSFASPVQAHPARAANHLVFTSVRQSAEVADDQQFLLTTLAQMWSAGVRVNGRDVYAGETRYRIALPTYPFERKRFFIEPGTAGHASRSAKAADWLYAPVWERATPLQSSAVAPGRWLVLSADEAISGAVVQALRDSGADVTVAVAAARLAASSSGPYGMRPGNREDADRLLAAMGALPDFVLNLWPIAVADAIDTSCFSTLFMGQALAGRDATACRILVVTTGACRVIGNEAIDPLKATALGPVRVIPQELEGFSCAHVDVDPRADPRRLAAHLIAEVQRGADTSVAYRHDLRWVRRCAPVDAAETAGTPRLRDRGAYLVTGGLGGVGLELADAIAHGATDAHLILIGRTTDETRRSAAIERLQKAGARVTVLTADVADPIALRAVFDEAESLAGPIAGVVHAAGIAGGGSIALRSRAAMEEELAAKVRGTMNLHAISRGRGLDFLVLCSSTSAFTGGFGSIAYTSANAFLDAFAEACASAGEPGVIAVNWYRWQATGMAIAVERLHHELTGDTLRDGIPPAQGRAAFLRLLSRPDIGRVAVCPIDLNRLERSTRTLQTDQAGAPADVVLHERPGIDAAFEPPVTATEQAIAAVWRDVLGIDRIGLRDPFTMLGGDSLLAVRIATRMRVVFAIALPVRLFYELPTIAELARHIDAAEWVRDSKPADGSASIGFETGVL